MLSFGDLEMTFFNSPSFGDVRSSLNKYEQEKKKTLEQFSDAKQGGVVYRVYVVS